MPKFRYVAKKSPTEIVEDVLDVDSKEAVMDYLTAMGYTPLRIHLASEKVENEKKVSLDAVIPAKHLALFTTQFASLSRSQVPILRALKVLEEQTLHEKFKRILHAMAQAVEKEGLSLSEAMRDYPKAFPSDFMSLIHAGEVGGAMDQVLEKLAEKAEREEAMRAKIQSALVYPLFIGAVGILTVLFLILFVMPKILKMLTRFGGDLPLPTKMLMALTEAMFTPWFWLGAVFVIAGLIVVLRGLWKKFRLKIDEILLKLPLLGKLFYELELVRFARSLGLLLDHGVLMLQALSAAMPVVRNTYLREELKKLPAVVKEGGALTEGFKQVKVSNTFFIQTVSIGEEGGKLGEALGEVASFYEREVNKLIEVCASLIEPLMILLIGSVVGFIVLSVLLPIFEMSAIAR